MRSSLVFAGVVALSALILNDHASPHQVALGFTVEVADVHLSLEAKASDLKSEERRRSVPFLRARAAIFSLCQGRYFASTSSMSTPSRAQSSLVRHWVVLIRLPVIGSS